MRVLNRLQCLQVPLLLVATISSAPGALAEDAASGLIIEYTKKQTCNRSSQVGDKIAVNYRGTLQSDGSQFDASYDRGVPFTFKLGKGQVIKGWDEGLLDMCVGDARTLTIPPEMAYGHRNLGVIPPDSTLIFETELMEIFGVPAETVPVEVSTTSTLATSTIASSTLTEAFSTPVDEDLPSAVTTTLLPGLDVAISSPPPSHKGEGSPDGPKGGGPPPGGECRLLGPFALVVQAVLGAIALLSLVFKRWRERPRRPLKIWFFDVSKQIAGTFLLHLINLGMSTFSSGYQQRKAEEMAAAVMSQDGRMPNPCSFYLLNLAIDTTIGIPVLVVLLGVLHKLFLYTSLANPPESIKSGHYGEPPRATWWLKQSLIYFVGLIGMKLFVFFLFQALPWLAWVGDWALRWTEGNETLQIAFVMFIFPVVMNAIQYYVIDSFIKKSDNGDDDGFQRVPSSEESSLNDGASRRGLEEDDDEVDEAQKKQGKFTTKEDLTEANPTPVPDYDGEGSSSSSRKRV